MVQSPKSHTGVFDAPFEISNKLSSAKGLDEAVSIATSVELVTTASMHLVKPLHWILAKSYAFERSTARASNIEVGVRFGHGRRE